MLVQHDPLVPISVMRTSSISNMSGHDTKLSSSGKLIRASLVIFMDMTDSRVQQLLSNHMFVFRLAKSPF